MWEVENCTPFASGRAFLRDHDGAETWVVVLGATYTVTDGGEVRIADQQVPVCEVPEYSGAPGASSLRRDTDIVLRKSTTDILLTGSAYAPHGRAVSQLPVSLAVGNVKKTLWVYGDRVWIDRALGVATRPIPFESMPVAYEYAYGGGDPARPELAWRGNPVGRGYLVPGGNAAELLPNIVDGPQHSRRVAGFGPIDRSWSPRAELAGSYDEGWRKLRFPLPPANFSDEFYLCSPADQRPASHLRGGEPVVLLNLSRGGSLSFKIPLVRPLFHTRIRSEIVRQESWMHSLILEPSELRFQIVWQSALSCHRDLHTLQRTRITLKKVV